MSSPRIDDAQLQLLHDGELPADEATELRAAVASDPEAQRALEAIETVGAEFRAHAACHGGIVDHAPDDSLPEGLSADSLDAVALGSRMDEAWAEAFGAQATSGDEVASRGRLKLVSDQAIEAEIDLSSTKPGIPSASLRPAAPPSASLIDFEAARERRQRRLVTGAGVLAVAAAALLWIVGPGEDPGTEAPLAKTTPVDAAGPDEARTPRAPRVVAAVASIGLDIEELDFGLNPGTVEFIQTQGAQSVVLWIGDDPAGDGAPGNEGGEERP